MAATDGGEAGAAFATFLTACADGRRALFNDRPGLDALEVADGEAFCTQVVETALQLVPVDPARPAFVPWQTPTRRYTDNGPQSVYSMAFVDEAHRYRVSGRRADECYLSISLYAIDGGQPDRQVLSVNHHDLGAAPGEPFAVDVQPTDGGCVVLTRQYFLDPERDVAGKFAIEVLDGPPPVAPTREVMDGGWRRAARCVSALTVSAPLGDPPPPWVSYVANTMGDPSGWETDPVVGRSATDQIYASGPFELANDEALVMETVLPRCAYASVTVWNRFSQSVDARFHRSTLNQRSAVAAADGTVRAVVAPHDPSVLNWLDTGGRRRGTVFWRFLLVEGPVHPITCRVVPLDAL